MKRQLTEARLPAGKLLATFDFENVLMVALDPVLNLLGVVAVASSGTHSKTHRLEISGMSVNILLSASCTAAH
jgi:hypothetical protein